MNTERFNTAADYFLLFDLQARCDFKTVSSISFCVCQYIPEAKVWYPVGTLDVHHPVLNKPYSAVTWIRGALPMPYLQKATEGNPAYICKVIWAELEIEPTSGGTGIFIREIEPPVIDVQKLKQEAEKYLR